MNRKLEVLNSIHFYVLNSSNSAFSYLLSDKFRVWHLFFMAHVLLYLHNKSVPHISLFMYIFVCWLINHPKLSILTQAFTNLHGERRQGKFIRRISPDDGLRAD